MCCPTTGVLSARVFELTARFAIVHHECLGYGGGFPLFGFASYASLYLFFENSRRNAAGARDCHVIIAYIETITESGLRSC